MDDSISEISSLVTKVNLTQQIFKGKRNARHNSFTKRHFATKHCLVPGKGVVDEWLTSLTLDLGVQVRVRALPLRSFLRQ